MTKDQLKELLDDTHRVMCLLSSTKGEEYCGSEDRLANFKRQGLELGILPERVLWIFFNKHRDAIVSYIRELDRPTKRVMSEPIEGRIDDAILYLILLKGLIAEREGLPDHARSLDARKPSVGTSTFGLSVERHTGPVVLVSGGERVDRGEVSAARSNPGEDPI